MATVTNAYHLQLRLQGLEGFNLLRDREGRESSARSSRSCIEGTSSGTACLFEIDHLSSMRHNAVFEKFSGGKPPQYRDGQV